MQEDLNMFKNLIKNEKGQSAIEFAIILPILIMILGGIIDFGWIFTNKNIIDHLSREGARYAIVHATGTGAVTSIKDYTKSLAPLNISDTLIVDVTFSNPSQRREGDVSVSVSGDVNVLTPIVGVFTQGQKINLSSSCTMKVE